ncbi:hypothetical protein DQ04_00021290 [Trypanosoma grayi]|uniref:hypothetical protein n=1 Tax=Trypanosoma grayi TaxID=71804 RepID=UPI0004F3FC97|nr:hypothetical protein DQ04_00021290 [Trypanosoma grayi]KEG15631.1 hypothetical protein DQ04_00021290 [Trypanosoma grayi]
MMHTRRSFSPSRTLPLKGVQHITSPAVPSVVLGKDHLPQLPYTPILHGESGQGLSETLRDIGPSARLLIGLQTKNSTRSDGIKRKKAKFGGGGGGGKGKKVSADAQPVELKATAASENKPTATTLPDTLDEGIKLPSSLKALTFCGGRPTKALTAKAMDLTRGLNQTYTGTRDTSNTLTSRTVSKKMLPPLAVVLEQYIQREMGTTLDADGISSAQNRLRPFREAFYAFIDSFPAYSKILNDIMTAYDNVIQEQAGMIADVISEQGQHQLAEEQHLTEVAELNKVIMELTAKLEEARNSLDERESLPPSADETNESPQQQQMEPLRTKKTYSSRDKLLLEALQKIKKLEEVNKSDLEKTLVLINAIRESDRRAKGLEIQLAATVAQVDELDEFKVMAGEAQKQLEEFKLKYQNFISVQDHELIKEYLSGELQAAQHMARQYRRSAAVRGTQVDVIGRKLKALQDENEQLLESVEDERRELLTPRPDWNKIYASLPDIKENATSIEALPLEGDEAITSNVTGLSETRLQVEYLAERINSLTQELQRRAMVPMPTQTPKLPLIGQGVEPRVPLYLRACGIIPRVPLDPMEVLYLVHDFFQEVLQPHPDVLLYTLDIPPLYLEFLLERMGKREALKVFVCAEHLAINLADMANDTGRSRPSLLLLDGILRGVFPARIACDVMMVLENVRSELQGLSEAQRKTRLRRTAISDCIAPVLQLKSVEEIDLLKDALSSDTTHDVVALNSTGSKFMSTLIEQECASGMVFYTRLVEKLTSYAHYLEQEGANLVISLDDVGRAITEVEPLTPKPIIKEITEKFSDTIEEGKEQTTRLSEVIHALAAAPVIRRTTHRAAECGVL